MAFLYPVSHNFTRETVKEDPQIRSVGLGKKWWYVVIRILSQFGLALNLGTINK